MGLLFHLKHKLNQFTYKSKPVVNVNISLHKSLIVTSVEIAAYKAIHFLLGDDTNNIIKPDVYASISIYTLGEQCLVTVS